MFSSAHSQPAQVAESVDAADLKSAVRKDVRVQVPPWAPTTYEELQRILIGQYFYVGHFWTTFLSRIDVN